MNDKLLYEKMVSFDEKDFNILFQITDKKLIFQKMKGLFKKKYKVIEEVKFSDIKIINDNIKMKQKKNKLIIYTNDDKISFTCENYLDTKKIEEEIKKAVLGENFIVRSSNKVKKAANTVKAVVGAVAGVGTAAYTAYKYATDKDTKQAIINGAKAVAKTPKAIAKGTKEIVSILKK